MTISYGNWPNDVFLLFFGFVPSEGELQGSEGQGGSSSSDSVILFSGLQELALCYHELVQQRQGQGQKQQLVQGQEQGQGWQQGQAGPEAEQQPAGSSSGKGQVQAAAVEQLSEEQVQERVVQLWKQALMGGALRLGEDYGRCELTGRGPREGSAHLPTDWKREGAASCTGVNASSV